MEHMFSEQTLGSKLNMLLNLPGETEVVEFKEAKNTYDFSKLGKYFSALSNEANLKAVPYAWLVFGVADASHEIVGSHFRPTRKDLDSLKAEMAARISNRLTFIEIYELIVHGKRVVMFQIPAAPQGMSVDFEGHYYGRNGEQLCALNIEEIQRVRNQSNWEDWSAVILDNATIEDLDSKAIEQARINYKNKFSTIAHEVDGWDDETFLNKAKILIKGKVTRTAIILLGKEESEHFITPSEAKIRWILKDMNGDDKDYEIIGLPLLLAVDKAYGRIRNLKYRYLKEGTLFPDEVDQYEPYAIREALNNCIAHQDYKKGGRINLVETEDQLVFTNMGDFIPGSVEKVIMDNAPEEQYRNKFLATAMFNLKMVDTIGSGIRKIFSFQRKRYFPLPDYDLTGGKVKVTLIGKVLNQDYARILATHPTLSLEQVLLLDKVQKKQLLNEIEEKSLKSANLIEGRKPNFYFSKKIAQTLGKKAEYSKNRAFDKAYYLDLVEKAIGEHGNLNRKEVDDLLWNKLPEWMDEKQKKIKINNLPSELRNKGRIRNAGSDAVSHWILNRPQNN